MLILGGCWGGGGGGVGGGSKYALNFIILKLYVVCMEHNICKVKIFSIIKYLILKTNCGTDESTLYTAVITATLNSQIPEERTLQFAVSQEVGH